MGLDFLAKLIAQLLDKFKAGSPVLFVIVAALLSAVKYVVEAGVFPIDPKITEWVLWVVALVLGSRTTSYLAQK